MSSKRTNVLWTIVPPFSDCVPRGQDHLQSLPRSTTTCKWSRNQNHIKLLQFNLSLKWKLTSLSVSSSSLVEMQLWVNVIVQMDGLWWFSWTWPLSCSEKRIIFDDFQHIPASLAWYLCCHPSRRQQPQKLTLMLKWCSSWTGQCKKNGNFDSKTYKSTHVFCVCVSPLLKAPLLLADWLPARNLRVSFSFS